MGKKTGNPFEQRISDYIWLALVAFGLIIMQYRFLIGMVAAILFGTAFVAFSFNPKNRTAKNYDAALRAYREKRYEQAIALLKGIIEEEPLNKKANLLLSDILFDVRQNYNGALLCSQRVLQVEPDNTAALFKFAECKYELKRYDEAIKVLQDIPGPLSEQWEYKRTFLLGRSFFEKGKYDTAIELFQKGPVAKEIIDEHVLKFRYWLGISYLRTGDKQKAKAQFVKIYSKDSMYEDVNRYAVELGIEE